MQRPWTPRRQGDAGELSAMQWVSFAGALDCKPLFECPDYDLVADWGDRLERVQVKTSIAWRRGRYEVTLVTRGGNQSWNGIVKHLDGSRCDALFAHVGDGRRWYIPVAALDGTSKVNLGGPKYAEYEVARGAPLQPRTASAGVGIGGLSTLN